MAKTLSFRMQQQALSQWCWAAAAASISDYYKDTRYESQCAFVSSVTGMGDCCRSCHDDGEASVCNQPYNLGSALWKIHHGLKIRPDPADFDEVKTELDADRPVACNVYWRDRDVHALVICGYTDDGMLLIADPEKPGTVVSISRDFIYSTTYDAATEAGKITEIFRTK